MKDYTELVFILDRSGSMHGLEADTIGGFNAIIDDQKKEDGDCVVSTVLFNQYTKVIHDRVSLDQIRPMTDADYRPGGCTALIDAIGGAIHHIGNIHKYARKEDVPKKTLFIITTDGLENASHAYTAEQVRHMISRQKEKYGWEFLFLGANIDAVETAARYGISPENAVNYHADEIGTSCVYEAMSAGISMARSVGHVAENWKNAAEEDFKKRLKRHPNPRQNG